MRVVVTGGAGFLGAHLCGVLLARGDEVVVVDNMSTGQWANVDLFLDHPGYAFIDADVSWGLPVHGAVDAVAHLASPAQLTGSYSEIQFHPLPQDDPTRRCPDITKAQTILEWEPVVNAQQGLARTIEWFKGRPEQVLASVDAVAGAQFEGHDMPEQSRRLSRPASSSRLHDRHATTVV